MKYEQFESFLDEDLSWRKKEISQLFLLAKDIETEVIYKSIILLLYAHWEGYIKLSSKLYLKYVSEQKIILDKLSNNFKATVMKSNINRCLDATNSLSLSHEIDFMNKFSKLKNKRFNLTINTSNDQDKSVIDTKSNLNPKVLKNIYTILGIKYKHPLETRSNYINSHLLYSRNTISHGSKFDNDNTHGLSLSLSDIEKLKKTIFILVDNFRDELLEFAYHKYFLDSNIDKRNIYESKKSDDLEKELKLLE